MIPPLSFLSQNVVPLCPIQTAFGMRPMLLNGLKSSTRSMSSPMGILPLDPELGLQA